MLNLRFNCINRMKNILVLWKEGDAEMNVTRNRKREKECSVRQSVSKTAAENDDDLRRY